MIYHTITIVEGQGQQGEGIGLPTYLSTIPYLKSSLSLRRLLKNNWGYGYLNNFNAGSMLIMLNFKLAQLSGRALIKKRKTTQRIIDLISHSSTILRPYSFVFFVHVMWFLDINNGVYPPKRAAKAVPKVVQLFLLVFYFCFSKRILDFQFTGGNSPFLDLEKYFIPRSEQRKQYRRWSN